MSEDFIAALTADFIQHGCEVIEKVRVNQPMAYLKLIASVIPRDVIHSVDENFDDLSDEDLERLLLDAAFRIAGDHAPTS